MTAILNQAELIEAVKEWCDKRGLPSSTNVEFTARNESYHINSSSYTFEAKVLDLEMKNGPYR